MSNITHSDNHKTAKITDDSAAVILGAGPVGCLMACFLLKSGVKEVTLYEKRRDPRVWQDSGKSINLALSARGLTALKYFDERIAETMPCLKSAVPMRGRQIWSKSEIMYQPYSENPSVEYLNSINRAHLNNDLINLAISEGAKIVFAHPVQGVDFENKKVILFDEKNKQNVTVPYKTLWGMDGSNSRVRSELERIHGLPKDSGVVKFKAGYKEFEILPDKNGKAQLHPVDAFHVWPRDGGNFFIALPNADNTFTCTMFTTLEDPEYLGNLNEETIVKLFEREFPDVLAIMGKDKIVSDFKTNPLSGLYYVDAKHWHYKGEVVIMGDAAHGTVPYYGLGVNGGFEGCRHMFNIIRKHTRNGVPDWNQIFTEFSGFKVHSDILRILSVRNADELHSKVKSNEFLFEKEVERCLQSKYPTKFVEDHALLSFTNVPLETCMRQFEKQEEIVKTLVKGKHNIKEIDWQLADTLVNQNSLLENSTLWYEKSKL